MEETKDNVEINTDHLIPYSEVTRFFKGVEVDSTCPACKNTKWNIPIVEVKKGDFAQSPGLVATTGNSDFYLRGALPTIAAFCTKCGFVRLHFVEVMRSWLSANPAPNGDNGDTNGQQQ